MSILTKFQWFLVPSVVQGLVSLGSLPLATSILGPTEYGVFAFVSSITSVGAATACLGSTYFLSMAFSESRGRDLSEAISWQLIASLAVALLLSVCILLGFSVAAAMWPNLGAASVDSLLLASLSMVGNALWIVAVDVLMLDGKARAFAMISIGQSGVYLVSLMVSLFVFRLEGLSLFVAAFLSSAWLAIGACLTMRAHFALPRDSRWLRRLFKGTGILTLANIAEILYVAFERNLLVVWSSVGAVGIYAHSQQYRTMLAMPIKAMARSVWPTTLEEAKSPPLDYRRTGCTWRFVHILTTLCGVVFVAVGGDIIGLLTNGKFIEAAPLASFGIAYLLVANSGKPATGLVYARGDSRTYGWLSLLSTGVAFAVAAIFVPLWSAWGAVAALFGQQIALRLGLFFRLRRVEELPFQDGWVFVGLLLICVLSVTAYFLNPPLGVRVAAMFLIVACLSPFAMRAFREFSETSVHQPR